MERDFDRRAVLRDVFDFVTCQRPDGSFYGNGGAACRKGAESSLPSKEGRISGKAKAIVESMAKAQLEGFGNPDKEAIAANITKVDEEISAQVQRLQDGSVSKEEIDNVLVKHLDFDIAQSEFVFIGMENGLDTSIAGENGSESAGQLSIARMLASQQLAGRGELTRAEISAAHTMSEVSLKNKAGEELLNRPSKLNSYVGATTHLAVQATGGDSRRLTVAEADGIYFGGLKMSTIEMSVPAAVGTGDGVIGRSGKGSVNSKGINSTDPNRSMYGALINGQAGPKFTGYDRAYVKKQFEQKRAEFVSNELTRAARSPNFKGGFGAPGSGAKYENFKSSVIDSLARSGKPTYTTKVDLSTGSAKGGRVTKSHTLHIVELGRGKYLVTGDFSMNTNAYSSNNNHLKAYQTGIASVIGGKAAKYTPPSASAPAKRSAGRPPSASAPAKRSAGRPRKEASSVPAPKRVGASASKIELRRAIQKAKREGRASDALRLEKTLKDIK